MDTRYTATIKVERIDTESQTGPGRVPPPPKRTKSSLHLTVGAKTLTELQHKLEKHVALIDDDDMQEDRTGVRG